MGFLSSIGKGIKKVVKGVGKAVKKVGSAIVKGAKKVIKGVGKVLGKLGPIGTIAIAFFAPYAVGFLAAQGGFLGAVGSGLQAVGATVSAPFKALGGALGKATAAGGKALGQAIGKAGAQSIGKFVETTAVKMGEYLGGKGIADKTWGEAVKAPFGAAKDAWVDTAGKWDESFGTNFTDKGTAKIQPEFQTQQTATGEVTTGTVPDKPDLVAKNPGVAGVQEPANLEEMFGQQEYDKMSAGYDFKDKVIDKGIDAAQETINKNKKQQQTASSPSRGQTMPRLSTENISLYSGLDQVAPVNNPPLTSVTPDDYYQRMQSFLARG